MFNRINRFFYHPFVEYLVVYLLIATSGIMFFYKNDEYTVIGFLIGGLVFFARKKKLHPFFILTLVLFLSIELLQMTYFGSSNFITSIGTIAKLGLAYFAVVITGKNFADRYIKILYVSAIISLFFYGLTFIPGTTSIMMFKVAPLFKPIFSISSFRYAYSANIIVYNYNYEHVLMMRNVGPFWESGAFGVYLGIAIMLNLIRDKNIFNKINLVLFITILTTVSTAAYLALFFFMFAYYLTRRDVKYKLAYIFIVGALSMYGFFTLPFMQEKIEQNIASSDSTTKSRFGSAKADIQVFQMSPFFGFGRTEKNKQMISKRLGVLDHRNNGVTGLLASYGIIIFLFYFGSYFHSFVSYSREHYDFSNYRTVALIFILTILLIGFSQRIFLYPFFFALMFMHIIKYDPNPLPTEQPESS